MFRKLSAKLRGLLSAQNGSIAVMGVMALASVLGMSGLAVEIGNGYATKVRNQRVADLAALGAAGAYSAAKGASQTATQSLVAAQATANDIVVANGLATSTATITPDSTTAPTKISVSITTAVPIKLARMIAPSSPTYDVTNAATASLGSSTTLGCVTALDGSASTGISISGSASLNVSGCAVSTNSAVQVDGSASIAAKTLNASRSVTISGSASLTADTITAGGAITKPQHNGTISGTQNPNTANSVSDPLSGNADLAAAFAELGQTTAPTTPAMASAPTFTSTTTNWTFPDGSSYAGLAATDPVKANCTYASNQYTCAAGTYNINNISIAGNMKVTFNGPSTISVYGTLSDSGAGLRFTGGAGSTFNFRNGFMSGSSGIIFGPGDVYIGGATLLKSTSGFGDGTITINGLLSTGGSSNVTIGNGVHTFGGIDVGGNGRLTVGTGNLMVTSGIATGGNTTTTFGAGTYVVGKDPNGYSINHTGDSLTFGAGNFSGTGGIFVSGSSTLTFGPGDLTLGASNSNAAIFLSGSSTLNMGAGNLNADGDVTTNGNSEIVFGVGSRHNIDGDLSIKGAATLGAGRYTIDGSFDKSASRDVTANNVTIIAAGNFNTSGSSSLTLSAPTSSAGGGIAGIAFASLSNADSAIEGSSQNTIGGIMYIPNSDLSVRGSGTASSSTCFALIVKTLTVTGSAGTASGCTMPTVGNSSSPKLIQ